MYEPYQALEIKLAEWIGKPVENVAVCSSGTSALELAFRSLQLPKGAKVVVPDFAMIACARAVTMAELEPVFVDCDHRGLAVKTEIIEAAKKYDARAILLVHTYGQRLEISFSSLPEHIAIVEDMAEIHGLRPSPRTNAAAWSFYKNKVLYGEEGGMVYCDDMSRLGLVRMLRNHGFMNAYNTAYASYMHKPGGGNHRLSNANAKLILECFDRLKAETEWRWKLFNALSDKFHRDYWLLDKLESPWVFGLNLPHKIDPADVIKRLLPYGIPARHAFYPITSQPEYEGHVKPWTNRARSLYQNSFIIHLGRNCWRPAVIEEAAGIEIEEIAAGVASLVNL